MSPETLEKILIERFDAAREGDAIIIPDGTRVTLLLVAGEALMPVTRVREVSFSAGYLALTTEEQRYFIDAVHVLGVRQEDYQARSQDSRPGFHRT